MTTKKPTSPLSRKNRSESGAARTWIESYFERLPKTGRLSRADHFLAELWMKGFKVAKVTEAELDRLLAEQEAAK